LSSSASEMMSPGPEDVTESSDDTSESTRELGTEAGSISSSMAEASCYALAADSQM
jgi:hypothetical protein